MNKRMTTELEKNVFAFLNDLRDSGVANMFGASPYVEEEFEVGGKQARELTGLWMKNFNEDGDYQEISI